MKAGVAELADALDLGSSGSNPLEVQILSPAPELTTLQCFRISSVNICNLELGQNNCEFR